MTGCRCDGARRGPRAFTLVEVLLTLSLLVIITALALPALDRPFSNQRLRRAADQIRGQWCGARVQAMESGKPYVFQYVAEGDQFRIGSQSGMETADELLPEDGSTAMVGEMDQASATPLFGRKLPNGIVFVGSETAEDTRTMLLQPLENTTAPAATQTGVDAGWSDAIYFYPDGTTSTARLVLKNQYGYCIELALRGLTGTVTVGEVTYEEGQ